MISGTTTPEPERTANDLASESDAALVRQDHSIDAIALDAVASPPALREAQGSGSRNLDRGIHDLAGSPEQGDGSLSESDATGPDMIDAIVGRRIGPYEIVARIGSEKMRNLYRGVRTEENTQQVVIKLVKGGLDSNFSLRQFRTEIQTQAVLGQHSHITALVDAGTTEDGWTYFVREDIDGQPIDEYCTRHRLDIPAPQALCPCL